MSKPRMTPHQTEVFTRISHRFTSPWCRVHGVPEAYIGSPGAVEHLIRKGYIKVSRVEYGPRGGVKRYLIVLPKDAGQGY